MSTNDERLARALADHLRYLDMTAEAKALPVRFVAVHPCPIERIGGMTKEKYHQIVTRWLAHAAAKGLVHRLQVKGIGHGGEWRYWTTP